jgi:drug/metabolite transporter (DMT)-like permease
MDKKRIPATTYALMVFLAGASYGLIVPLVRYASLSGLSVPDFLPSQYLLGLVMIAPVVFLRCPCKVTGRELVKLASLGLLAAGTSLCYYTALTLLPSTVALTLLFQFVWVGVFIECMVARRLPARTTVIAIAIVFVGTLLAAGVFEESFAQLDPLGLVCGFGSAVFYALFLFFSGRVGTHHPVPLRTAMLCVGGFIATAAVHPAYFTTALTEPATWLFSLGLAVLGIVIPVSFIAFASPHLNAGTVNVMASSELPLGIIAAWLVLGDQPTALSLLGVGVVLGGIVFNQVSSQREARKEKLLPGNDTTLIERMR